MASFSKIYIDLSTTNDKNVLRKFMFDLKIIMNKIIVESYNQMNIKDLEIGRAPLIRNSAKVSYFHYTPSIDSDAFQASFAYFVHKDIVGCFPKKPFNYIKDGATAYNQHRYLSAYYGHKDNDLTKYNVPADSDDIVIITLGDDFVGQSIIKSLSESIKSQYPDQIVLLEASSLKEDDLEVVQIMETSDE
jgi:hypothetical protein